MLNELKSEYQKALVTDDMRLKLNFINKLVACQSPECVDFHFDLLKSENKTRFDQMIRFSLRKRGEVIIPRLREIALDEENPKLQADAIQTLGNLRDRDSIPIILSKLSSQVTALRYSCIISLGWMGGSNEARLLEEHYASELDPLLRGYCATSIRQIYLTNKMLKDELLFGIRKTFLSEQSEEARRCIVLSTQTIASESFGLRESTKTGKVTGDVDKAWKKLLAYFADGAMEGPR